MSFKNRFVILSSGFLIFAAVSTAPAAQATQEKNNQQTQQDRTNNANRKQWSKQHTTSKTQVRQVQTALKNRGFDPGPIDGVMGPKTMMAIRNFQSSQGMTASGMIDESTLTALQIQIEPSSGSTSSPQTSSNVGNSQLPQQGNQPPEALPRTEASPSEIGVGPTAFDREDVREAQMALKNRGFDPGEMNGMISSQTQEAIRQFQRASGLPVNGKLDQRTQAALGITIKGTSQDERIAKPGGPSAESEPQDTSKYDKTSKIDKDAQERLEKSASVLQYLTGVEDKRIPDALLERAEAIAVIPHMVKGAFGIGGRYGKGVVSERLPNGRWSSPAFIQIGGGSFGLQLGASATDVVMVFTDKKALDLLEKGKDLKLGVDAGVVAGPIGRQAEAGVNANLKTAIYAYSRAKGLFAGVALDGAVLDIDDSMNNKVYGPTTTATDILNGRVQMTPPDPFTAALDRIVPKKKISER
jgi:lipid-binding SYLF domain-containing protein